VSIPPADMDRLRRRGFRLEYATMAWMIAEAAVAITAGLIAASIALVGFGQDSVIELFSATIVIWRSTPSASPASKTRPSGGSSRATRPTDTID